MGTGSGIGSGIIAFCIEIGARPYRVGVDLERFLRLRQQPHNTFSVGSGELPVDERCYQIRIEFVSCGHWSLGDVRCAVSGRCGADIRPLFTNV
jgi:hypothetical protein